MLAEKFISLTISCFDTSLRPGSFDAANRLSQFGGLIEFAFLSSQLCEQLIHTLMLLQSRWNILVNEIQSRTRFGKARIGLFGDRLLGRFVKYPRLGLRLASSSLGRCR